MEQAAAYGSWILRSEHCANDLMYNIVKQRLRANESGLRSPVGRGVPSVHRQVRRPPAGVLRQVVRHMIVFRSVDIARNDYLDIHTEVARDAPSMRQANGGGAAPSDVIDPDGRDLAAACARGDPRARQKLQEIVWPLIPKVIRSVCGSNDGIEPGDLLLYAIDNDRIYKNLAGFQGRASLKGYLLRFVLRQMLLKCLDKRQREFVQTVAIDEHRGDFATSDPPTAQVVSMDALKVLRELPLGERLLLKLLYVEDCDLNEEERQELGRRRGCPLTEVDKIVDAAREVVRQRELRKRETFDKAAVAARDIEVLEAKRARLSERISHSGIRSSTRSRVELARIESKIERRKRRHLKMLEKGRHTNITLPYREIAMIMGSKIGTVTSRITRLRQSLCPEAPVDAGARS